jgi:pimeloyl-ACP methyl ester carboxylesterase
MAQDCAPSLWVAPFVLIEGLDRLLAAGYTVVATDYAGLGVAGPSAYLVGASEAHNLLDAVRAARHLPDAQAGDRVFLWGHSQGGQAVLFAAQQARADAPELTVVAAAVAAPAVELGELLRDDVTDVSGVTLGSYAFATYAQVYADVPGVDLGRLLTPEGAAAVPRMAALCLLTKNSELHAIAAPLVDRFLAAQPATTPPWSQLLADNTPGAQPLGVPVLVNQGLADVLVRPATTAAYVASLCAADEHVAYRTVPGAGHGEIALDSVDAVVAWFAAAASGRPQPATC